MKLKPKTIYVTLSPEEHRERELINEVRLELLKQYENHPLLVKDISFVKARSSSKLNALLKLIDSRNEKKWVIFTTYRKMADILRESLSTRYPDVPVTVFIGGMSHANRLSALKRFNDAKTGIFVTTDAGAYGTELNAPILVNYDIHRNPALMTQRIGRVYRINQPIPVVINLKVK